MSSTWIMQLCLERSPWMFINWLTISQNNRKLTDNIANTANLTNNGLTNVLTRLTLAATGIDLLARRGISLADTRPTKVSVSRTSKWLMLQGPWNFLRVFMTYLLSSCLASWAKHERIMTVRSRTAIGWIQSSHYKPRRALPYTMFSRCLSSVLLR